MKLSGLVYPLFRIKGAIKTEDGITYAISQTNRIVDNKNLLGDTLVSRRLQYDFEELCVFGDIVYSLNQLHQNQKTNQVFIDSIGNIFKFKKHKFCKLTCHTVKAITYTSDFYTSYLKVSNCRTTIKYLGTTPPKEESLVGLVHYRGGKLLYGQVDKHFKDTRIKL